MNTNKKFDVAVIGAGAMGSAAAYHLAKAGARVVAFDQHTVPHPFGSSHAETRLIRQAYFEDPSYVPLLRRAYELWDELEDFSGQLFVKNGLFVAGNPNREILQGITASAKMHQIPIESFSATEARIKFPGFHFQADDICLFEPNAGYLIVDECIRAAVQGARKFGAEILENCRISSISKTPTGFELNTGTGSYKSKKVVLASGAWTSTFLPVSFRDKFVPHRVPLFWFNELKGSTQPNTCFAFDTSDGFYYGFPPLNSSSKLGLHKTGPKIDDPSNFSREIGEDERRVVLDFLRQRLNFLEPKISREATCIYTMTPDENFVIDEIEGMVILAGFSGHGFKFATVIGEIAKDLVLHGKTPHPIGFLRWRF